MAGFTHFCLIYPLTPPQAVFMPPASPSPVQNSPVLSRVCTYLFGGFIAWEWYRGSYPPIISQTLIQREGASSPHSFTNLVETRSSHAPSVCSCCFIISLPPFSFQVRNDSICCGCPCTMAQEALVVKMSRLESTS